MESNLRVDSKSPSEEETDRSGQANDDMGTGRSYECVFCKRGFTTAQALGGHMNIHRKDRAKPRPSSVIPSISSKVDDDYYASLRGSPSIQSYPSYYSPAHHHHEVLINYQTLLPAASTWGFRSPQSDDLYMQSPQLLNPFEEDWRRSLSLQIGPSHVDDNKEKTEDGSEADELDLELRLGHDP